MKAPAPPGFKPIIKARHSSGFEVLLQLDNATRIDDAVAWLQQHGYTPTTESGDGWRRTPEGLPICPRHQSAMSRREKQGDTWHSHRVVHPDTGEELYCRGYPAPTQNGQDGWRY